MSSKSRSKSKAAKARPAHVQAHMNKILGAQGGNAGEKKSKKDKKDKKDKDKKFEKDYFKLTGHDEDRIFLCNPSFSNKFPGVPTGPYFKQLNQSRSFHEFAKYKPSTLEKNYIWQPHFGPFMNLKDDINFVDQEILFKPTHDVDKEIKAYTTLATTEKGNTKRSNSRKEHAANHWWLRDTQYFENQLFKEKNLPTNGSHMDDFTEHIDPFDKEYIEKSFEAAETADERDDVEWSMPLLPAPFAADSTFSIARFTEDPAHAEVVVDDTRMGLVGEKRMRQTLLTNARASKKKSKSYAVSLLCNLDENSSSNDSKGDIKYYEWIKDYQMDLKELKQAQFILFKNGDAMNYVEIDSFFDASKVAVDEIAQHSAVVEIREEEERKL